MPASPVRSVIFADGSEKPLTDCTTDELIATRNAHRCVDEELLVYLCVKAGSAAPVDDPAVEAALTELAQRYGQLIFGDLVRLIFGG